MLPYERAGRRFALGLAGALIAGLIVWIVRG